MGLITSSNDSEKEHAMNSVSKKIILATLCLSSISLAGPVQTVGQWGHINWVKRVAVVTGIGAPSPDMPIAAARPNALRAAQMTALRNALEIVKGITINSTTTVENRTVGSDVVTSRIDGFLQGFQQQGKPKYMSDGTAELVIEVPIDGELANSLLPEAITDTPSIKKTLKATTKKPSFSGIIINCTGLKLTPSMLPAVFDDEGREVYGTTTISRSSALKWGAAGYASTIDSAKLAIDRVGTDPHIIKAAKVVGQNKTDIVLSKKDAGTIRNNPANYAILEECRIILIVD
jgi:hypothetical protein